MKMLRGNQNHQLDSDPEYFLFVEGEVICKSSSFFRMLMLRFISYYAFNLEYAKPIKEVGMFCQKNIFALPDQSKKTATYLTVVSDISKYCP